MKDYLKALPLSSAEREAVDKLSASTLFELVALAQAAPDAFSKAIQPSSLSDFLRRLRPLLTEREQHLLSQPVPSFALGARLDKRPI
jgi:hypothetical protein